MTDSFNQDFLIATDQYQETMDSVVFPFLKERETRHDLNGKDGSPLYCVSYHADDPAATILLLHGFTENALKYSELIYSLLQNHFSVLTYDQRGHGRSGRTPGISDSSVTHVNRFADYVDDLSVVCDRVLSGMPEPHMIFSHSMGGAVASLFLETRPEVFSAAVLCAPMIAPNTGAPAPVANLVCRAGCLLGRGKHRPFFLKPYSGPEDFDTSCATDPVRFSWYDRIKAARPEFRNSVPTYRWTVEAIGVTKQILSPGAPERIACPVLLTAADKDFSVMPEPQKKFIARVPKGRYMFFRNSRHEIFRSTNDVLFPWWHEVLSFFRNPC